MLIFVDTETTDYRPGQIAQLTYILSDGEQVTGAANYYFAVEYMSAGAEMVHGLSEELLWRLSEGRKFAERVDEFRGAFEERMFVAHNAPFDLGFLSAEFGRCGIPFAPSSTFCTMRMSTAACRIAHPRRAGFKWPKLEEAVRGLGISPDAVRQLAGELFGGDSAGFHDARFDTAAVYLIYRALMG